MPENPGEKVTGGLGLISRPRVLPVFDGFSTPAHSGAHAGQRRVSGAGRCVRMPPSPWEGHKGLYNAKHRVSGFELLWAPVEAQRSGFDGERRGKETQRGMPKGCSAWSGLCPDDGGLLALRYCLDLCLLFIQCLALTPMSAPRQRVLIVLFRLVHRSPRRLPRGCAPRWRGSGAAPGCSRRCWSDGRCR